MIFTDFEASFIRLLDKVTNGSKIVVSETGKAPVFNLSVLYSNMCETGHTSQWHWNKIKREIGLGKG